MGWFKRKTVETELPHSDEPADDRLQERSIAVQAQLASSAELVQAELATLRALLQEAIGNA